MSDNEHTKRQKELQLHRVIRLCQIRLENDDLFRDQEIIEQHPHLMPELEKCLLALRITEALHRLAKLWLLIVRARNAQAHSAVAPRRKAPWWRRGTLYLACAWWRETAAK